MKPFELILVLTTKLDVDQWIQFAQKLSPADGEIHLRALVTIEAGKSLSEGTLAAREWRDILNQAAQNNAQIKDHVQVHVDYHPIQRILEEVQAKKIDLLVLEWAALKEKILGLSLEELLQAVPCGLVIVNGIEKLKPAQNVVLALRGGPNLSIGTHVAQAVAGEGTITLFHAVHPERLVPDFKQ